MPKDLRTWIQRLESEGDLKRIKARVDWDGEIAEICRQVQARKGPALIFENIKGHEKTWCRQLLTGGQATPERAALGLGLPKNSSRKEVVEVLRKRFKEPLEPRLVATGPVKENIITGDAIDLFQIPVPKWHPLDAGRYINTWCAAVTKDPETGVHNAGVYRGNILAKDKIGVLLTIAQNWGTHYVKHQRLGTPMPVAMVYGWDPALVSTAGLHMMIPEYSAMGSMMQEPVPLVKCETSDLLVPASAEIVVEGRISPDPATYEVEGPYGESSGYYGRGRKRPVVKVECITHRNDAIFRGAINESSAMIGAGIEALAWNVLERQDMAGVLEVAAVGPMLAVKIRKTYQGQARHVAAAIWGSRLAITMAKIIIVVDEERAVDIRDPMMLWGAVSMHVDAAKGIVVYPMQVGTVVDQSLSSDEQDELEYGDGLVNKLLIDATVDWTKHRRDEYWGGRRLPPDSNMPFPGMPEQVQKRWKEYGL